MNARPYIESPRVPQHFMGGPTDVPRPDPNDPLPRGIPWAAAIAGVALAGAILLLVGWLALTQPMVG